MLEVRDLRKSFGEVEAVKGASLEVSPREILAVVGPSGCGKTTLLRLMAGLERPDGGWVRIDGVEHSSNGRLSPPNARGLSMIFQDLALWPHMSVRGHILFVLKGKGVPRAEREAEVMRVLQEVKLLGLEQRRPQGLSGGERQRLALGRALACRPSYLLMDEPLSNLDPLLRGELQALILEQKERSGMGIVYVTHQLEDGLAISERMAIMNEGRMIQVGPKAEVLSHPADEFVRRYLGTIRRGPLELLGGSGP